MNDNFSPAAAVKDGDLRPETLLQAFFDVGERRTPQLFCAAFPDNYAGFENFFRFAYRKVSSDDELRHTLLLTGARDP